MIVGVYNIGFTSLAYYLLESVIYGNDLICYYFNRQHNEKIRAISIGLT